MAIDLIPQRAVAIIDPSQHLTSVADIGFCRRPSPRESGQISPAAPDEVRDRCPGHLVTPRALIDLPYPMLYWGGNLARPSIAGSIFCPPHPSGVKPPCIDTGSAGRKLCRFFRKHVDRARSRGRIRPGLPAMVSFAGHLMRCLQGCHGRAKARSFALIGCRPRRVRGRGSQFATVIIGNQRSGVGRNAAATSGRRARSTSRLQARQPGRLPLMCPHRFSAHPSYEEVAGAT